VADPVSGADGLSRKLLFGYLPFTAGAIVVAWLLLAASRSWSAVLAGGVLLVFWVAAIMLSQLLILCVKRDACFVPKCIGITAFSLFVAPLVLAFAYTAGDRLIKGRPSLASMNRDLAQDAPDCRVRQVTKEKRMGGTTYYVEADMACSRPRKQLSCVWWYSYRDGKWSRAHRKDWSCPR
jgi:hypothetical protein